MFYIRHSNFSCCGWKNQIWLSYDQGRQFLHLNITLLCVIIYQYYVAVDEEEVHSIDNKNLQMIGM